MRPVLTTLHFPARSAWVARTRMLDRASMSMPRLLHRLLTEADPKGVVVLDGGVGRQDAYVDRVAAAALAHRRRRPHVMITDSTWSPGPGRRAALRLLDTPRTTYCVLSTSERESFPRTWGVDPRRVAFTPFYWTLPDAPEPRLGGTGIFAGGDSLRDHATLLAVAGDVPAMVTVASYVRPTVPLPPNVRLGPVPPERFLELMRCSAVVAVPLRRGLVRGAGQQTYLNAMALGKLVVVSDAPGARDYVEHGETGLVVPPGDPSALAEALVWATDPANAADVRLMRAKAHEAVVDRFSPDRYVESLLDVIDALPE